ncbi:MAG: helix-turn-helix domain-containing protein [Bacteroidales bacterium]
MNQRLQQLLTLESLTSAQLADKLGIGRSSISHILAGRNKPSYDFIRSILIKFPNLNADWFITGKGKPYKDSNDNDEASPLSLDEILPEDTSIPDYNISEEDDLPLSVPSKKDKKIKRITIFYSDGSFDEFSR